MSQVDLENWICGIHSACASSFARQHGKENTLKLLHSETDKLENSIDLVGVWKQYRGERICSFQEREIVDMKNIGELY